MNNRIKWLILPVATLALGSCGAQSIEGQLTAIQSNSNEIATALNEIQLAEGELQAAFEADIQSDESLTSLTRSDGQTHKNYSDRQVLLEDIGETLDAFNQNVVKLEKVAADTKDAENDKTQRQKEVASDVIKQSQFIADNLQGYINDYQANLDQEIGYYESLKAADADFKTYSNGMETINAGHKEAQTKLVDLKQQLMKLQETITVELEHAETDETAVNGNTLPQISIANFSVLFRNQIGVWTNGQ